MLGILDPRWLGFVGLGLGLVLLAWGLLGHRRTQPACRRCGHPIPPGAGFQAGPCVECGLLIRTPADLTARRRSIKKASLGLLCITSGLAFGIGSQGRMRCLHAVTPQYRVTTTQTWGDMTVRLSEPRWPEIDSALLDRVEVFRSEKLVWSSSIENPSAGVLGGVERSETPSAVWVREHQGGSGGYTTTFVFHTAAPGQFTPTVVLSDGHFEGDTWVQRDLIYRYWITSGAGSPVPELVGRWTEDHVSFSSPSDTAPRRAGPDRTTLDGILRTIRSSEPNATSSEQILSGSLRGFLDLVYAGRAEEAWRFLDECLAAGLEKLLASGAVSDLPRSREALRDMLQRQMGRSRFHPELLELNGGSIAPPDR